MSKSILITVPEVESLDWDHLRCDIHDFLEGLWFDVGSVKVDYVNAIEKRTLRQWEAPHE